MTHSRVAKRLNNLASIYFAEKQYDSVIEVTERALHIDETTFGDGHYKTAVRLNNLAAAYVPPPWDLLTPPHTDTRPKESWTRQ